MNNKDILKYLAQELLFFGGKVVLAMAALLAGIWLVGWIVELVATYIPVWVLFGSFLVLAVGMLIFGMSE